VLDTLESSYFDIVLPRDAMHERGLCRYAVSFRLSVRLSVTFVDHVKTNKRIFEIFSPSGNHTILGFPYLTGASNAGGVGKKRNSGRISGCIGHVCIGAYSVSTA